MSENNKNSSNNNNNNNDGDDDDDDDDDDNDTKLSKELFSLDTTQCFSLAVCSTHGNMEPH